MHMISHDDSNSREQNSIPLASGNKAVSYEREVQEGQRFEFGKNWQLFLDTLNDERIDVALNSLRRMLEIETLKDKRFLDIGSGSGLFSLAARRLGAVVHSFDFDPNSVACTRELKRRYFPNDPAWTVDEASALDAEYLNSLGKFDIVYSWGVLHHTGKMWLALDNIHRLVAPEGKLFIAIYNDQGSRSRRWLRAKRIYNRLPRPLKVLWATLAISPTELKALLSSLVEGKIVDYFRGWVQVDARRGMSRWRDVIDWVGGYPYEYASPDEIFNFLRRRGFSLSQLVCKGAGFGCIEYVFDRAPSRYQADQKTGDRP